MLCVLDILKKEGGNTDILVAEIDLNLLKKFRLLNINMVQIGSPKLIYASQAALAYIRMKDLRDFYEKNAYLLKKKTYV